MHCVALFTEKYYGIIKLNSVDPVTVHNNTQRTNDTVPPRVSRQCYSDSRPTL